MIESQIHKSMYRSMREGKPCCWSSHEEMGMRLTAFAVSREQERRRHRFCASTSRRRAVTMHSVCGCILLRLCDISSDASHSARRLRVRHRYPCPECWVEPCCDIPGWWVEVIRQMSSTSLSGCTYALHGVCNRCARVDQMIDRQCCPLDDYCVRYDRRCMTVCVTANVGMQDGTETHSPWPFETRWLPSKGGPEVSVPRVSEVCLAKHPDRVPVH
ncbi:hypothetical protein Tdes44962_MAKER05381 [Teratosphaeria destructans]|uniref:Uncharacterized protein n=1 Tax=Teratosphaeria destructans TaxID=418781 RepID=A0A9W7SK24_9PEZI|nr:hypothetical protein Tdes44962_MAKER05381 [Teratosphaeria destructans]